MRASGKRAETVHKDRTGRGGRAALTLLLALGAACESTSSPEDGLFDAIPLQVDHNRMYRAVLVAQRAGTVSVPVRPDWLAFDSASVALEGEPGWENRGTHALTLRIDGEETVDHAVVITVETGRVDCTQPFGDPAQSLYIMPIPAGVTSRVTQSYCRTGSGGHHQTYAYDFVLDIGDTIVAARAGLVYRVQESYQDGNGVPGRENFVYLEHDDLTVARYVHLMHRGALATVGQQLNAGDPIGLNGLTGGTSRPHLHFEVFRDRTFNDSTPDFAKRFSLPVNFRNAEGPLDQRGGLVEGAVYTALAASNGSRHP